MKSNKKLILIFGIAIAVLIFLLVVVNEFFSEGSNNTKQETCELVLLGDEYLEVEYNSKYQESGFYEKCGNTISTSGIKVTELDTSVVGEQTITYSKDNLVKTRTVKVKEEVIDEDNLIFNLQGDENIQIFQNEKYEDSGIFAYYLRDELSSYVTVKDDVNTSVPGIYHVTYVLNYKKINKTLERTVEVKKLEDLKINVNYDKTITNKDIEIKITAEGTNFLYLELPTGDRIANKNTSFKVSKNGTYTINAYDSYNKKVEKSVTISNIDKTAPTGSCKAVIKDGKTTITVTAKDNLGIKQYLYDNKYTSTSSSYTVNQKIKSTSVSIYDKAGNKSTANCSVENKDLKLEVHFIGSGHDDDSILLRTDDKVVMIDGGRWAARNNTINYLKGLGVTKIDALMGSHNDWNHIQTHGAILDTFTVDKLYYHYDVTKCRKDGACLCSGSQCDDQYVASAIKKHNKQSSQIILRTGDKFKIGDDLSFEVFYPDKNTRFSTDTNKTSIVMKMTFGKNTFLFTGDSNNGKIKKAITNMNNAKVSTKVDVFKMPHHGYNELESSVWKTFSPSIVISPDHNSCGSFKSSNKSRINSIGAKLYRQCTYKNIVLISDGTNIKVVTNAKASDYKR